MVAGAALFDTEHGRRRAARRFADEDVEVAFGEKRASCARAQRFDLVCATFRASA